MIRRMLTPLLLLLFIAHQPGFSHTAKTSGIQRDPAAKTITITVPDKNLSITIDYSAGYVIKQLKIKGQNVLSSNGIYTGIKTKKGTFSSAERAQNVRLTEKDGEITLSGLVYGDGTIAVSETWKFKVTGDKIHWNITRAYNTDAELEETAFPQYNFTDLNVWKGGILDNGGMVWCKYLKQVNDTYGVHTGGVTFWNAETGNALRISTKPDDGHTVASKYSHSLQNEFTATQLVTDSTLNQRYDLNRFVGQKADVFAPFKVKKGIVKVDIDLQYINYFAAYSRGSLPGIDATAVRELLNTTGRYGVVDNNIIGANGWLTNWKCLHEPFFAQIGMAVDDKNYTQNMSATLNQERDEAMLADGRVLSRWHNAAGDEIPGTYNFKTGYYEAMWGYTIDSQTGYVINASEQFDLNGDIAWLKSHQISCEKALDWLIKRDANHNGIFEMLNNNIAEKKASDWLDIVWASYENSFVNAQMYEALNLWANCESVLGNREKSAYYAAIAARLKTAFNKPIQDGGFWSPEKRQYVYWRDNDGSVHGDNLVTPVNFAAIAFGICDDKERIAQILDQIETRAVKENLFHWPLCFDSFTKEEVSGGNWPFPKYENGDIFPTWGYLGIRAYANYDKGIALKYINNLLQQYKKDGLSSQRYLRGTQLGAGEDILAGISTSITALYRDIYGIRPKWNRMGIEPNMSASLNGTEFSYTLRDTVYQLNLNVNNYTMSSGGFSITSKESFGANKTGNQLTFYPGNKDAMLLQIAAKTADRINMQVNSWQPNAFSWTITTPNSYQFTLKGLQPGSLYELQINNQMQKIKAGNDGSLTIKKVCRDATKFLIKIAV
ncbi:hypothetical protein SAMN05216464_102372 [Mucilaginibacter pineti]|uniref:Alpha-L-rhamnosidase six-hairpin glycosidase domain-containing protein n=1 Tax=Mucilaginibacter pineti TaxID=1391627 RepID=A0A1G6X3L3_9SPHI|nr:hypothetical protein [Mucilaginibacter pineti]SDD71997.1 hypothetical protein SAMN05216464_102372 [Mucilaginibacter pineti]